MAPLTPRVPDGVDLPRLLGEKPFIHVAGSCYAVRNQNGFNAALYHCMGVGWGSTAI